MGSALAQSSHYARFNVQAIRLQQPESWHALRTHLLDVIAALEEVFRRIKSPMTNRAPSDVLKAQLPIIRITMGSCHTRMQTVRAVLYEIYSRRLFDQASRCGLPQVMDRLSALDEVDRCMEARVGQAFTELTKIHIERFLSTEHSLTPQMLAMYKEVLVEYAELRWPSWGRSCVWMPPRSSKTGGMPEIIYGQRCSILHRHLPTNARRFLICASSPSRTDS